MIRLEDLYRDYGDFVLDISLDVAHGELVALLGPSGSGKTTTLRAISGFEALESGHVIVNKVDITALGPSRRKLGIVFQNYTLFPHLTVAENVAYGLRRHRIADVGAKVSSMLGAVGLEGFENRKTTTLSGGEAQRVAVARALVIEPEAFLLDEPFSAIDAPRRRELRANLVRIQRELDITTLFVTHSRQEALSIADRVALMRAGRLEQYGTPEDLYLRPKNRFVASFVGEANFLEGELRPVGAGRAVDGGPAGGMAANRSANAGSPPSGAPPQRPGRFRAALGFELDVETDCNPGPAILLFRPEHIEFGERPAGAAVRARVVSREYFGYHYGYAVEPTAGANHAGANHLRVFSSRRVEVGENVTVTLPNVAAHVLPAGG